MIKAYVAGISSPYEGEDIEIRYSIFENENLLAKEVIITDYKKPSTVGAVAFLRVLKALEKFKGSEVVLIVNDASLCGLIRGAGKSKDRDVQRLINEIQSELNQFVYIIVKDAGTDFKELEIWNEVLRA